jgi:hypothetical protein
MKTNKKKIKLTFDYETLTPVRTTGVFDENSNGWDMCFRLLYGRREDKERSGSIGGSTRSSSWFDKDIPQLLEQPPHQGQVLISGIEVYEEDEDGNKTEPRKLQYKDFPTENDWEVRKEEHQRNNPNSKSQYGSDSYISFIEDWMKNRKEYISDRFFITNNQHTNNREIK